MVTLLPNVGGVQVAIFFWWSFVATLLPNVGGVRVAIFLQKIAAKELGKLLECCHGSRFR